RILLAHHLDRLSGCGLERVELALVDTTPRCHAELPHRLLLAASRRSNHGRTSARRATCGALRDDDDQLGELAGSALGAHLAAVLLHHDVVADGEAQPGALAAGLGG